MAIDSRLRGEEPRTSVDRFVTEAAPIAGVQVKNLFGATWTVLGRMATQKGQTNYQIITRYIDI